MGLYNFRARFVPFIIDGSKRHTIRAPRRHPDRPGSVMHLYTGLRQKGARLLFRAPCAFIQTIALTRDARVILGGESLDLGERDRLAWEDGFRPDRGTEDDPSGAFALMFRFWSRDHVLPWEGHVYHWDYDARYC